MLATEFNKNKQTVEELNRPVLGRFTWDTLVKTRKVKLKIQIKAMLLLFAIFDLRIDIGNKF